MHGHGKNTRFSTERGFTLTEVLVAVGVFSILAAIAVPNFVAQIPTYQLNGAARQVFAELMWARAKAVEENSAVVVTFPGGTSYTITGGTWNRTTDVQADYPGATIARTNGIDPNFSPRGTTTTGATVITVTNASGTRTVTVSAAGIVRID